MTVAERMRELRGKRCTVIGLGISNLPLVRFLRSHGVALTARDRKDRAALGDVADELRALGVPLILGEDYLKDITEDVIFRSPGLRPDLAPLKQAEARGAEITSEMELFFSLTPALTVGITGSDGKTTTTTLTYLLLKTEWEKSGKGRVFVGGNIGEPLLPRVEEMTARDIAVVELSSFQLFDMKLSPTRAAITNLSPNHLDWHRDLSEYAEAKSNIFLHPQNQMLVTNARNGAALELAKQCSSPVSLFASGQPDSAAMAGASTCVTVEDGWITVRKDGKSERMLLADDILLPGVHNLENYMTAIALTYGMVSKETVKTVATTFRGVKHRLELVDVIDGVKYYNSSIDSTPTRTAAALSALKEKPIVICGGYDKHIAFAPLAKALKARAKAVVLTGATRDLIREALDAETGDLDVYTVPVFADAVAKAREIASSGDTVLLSPACASFDAFKNFEERGETFRRIVKDFSKEKERK